MPSLPLPLNHPSNLASHSPTHTSPLDQPSSSSSQVLRNRLLAKAQLRLRDRPDDPCSVELSSRIPKRRISQAGPYSSSTRDGQQSSSLQPAQNRSSHPKQDTPALRPLPNLIGKFVDYDLSTLKNSKGGFLLDCEEDDARALKQRQQIEELRKQRLKQAERYNQDPTLSLDSAQNPKCKICGTVELDFQLYQVFRVPVCQKCRNEHPDRFSLLTKTECKEDYLLTDPELKDADLLPHLLKANPHQSTYSNMMLYLREQVESYAFSDSKWGSPEALDEEFRRRENEKRKKKNKKFEERLKELRKKTRTNVWHRRMEETHVHRFGEQLEPNASNGTNVRKCLECGLETECETF